MRRLGVFAATVAAVVFGVAGTARAAAPPGHTAPESVKLDVLGPR